MYVASEETPPASQANVGTSASTTTGKRKVIPSHSSLVVHLLRYQAVRLDKFLTIHRWRPFLLLG